VKTLSNNNEQHLHQLNLDGMGNDAETDILQKIGLDVFRPEVAPIVEQVLIAGSASHAGLVAGDGVVFLNDVPTDTWSKAVAIIKRDQMCHYNLQ